MTTAQKEHKYSPVVKEYQQRKLVGIYTVTDGEHIPDKKPGYPLNLPVTIEFLKIDPREGLPLESIQHKIPWFLPRRGQSHQPISENEYLLLRETLINGKN